ncbi:MAG: electron transfer flavoprotein subunit beta/FixA family protein [Chloroflexi bacterium]|nr:electron transfer flavoprotein subunit beta/FixA family protein [Chloroflexota bacterium]MDA8186602.1 electron transfer flavoprotein subunit beta/FixA family protein [Dehalococcoidales bacterium]
MNIVVCLKQVPDTTAEKKLNAEFRLDRTSVENIVNPFDEYAVEEALKIKEQKGGTVTALSVGPESAKEALRKAIAMGVEKAMLVSDANLAGSDSLGTAKAIAGALSKLQYDIVLFGMTSTDAASAQVAGKVAALLNLPLLSYASKLEVGDDSATSSRQTDKGYDVISAKLPAVVSVVKGINEPRYPSLKGIMQAKRTPIDVLPLSDIGVDASEVGKAGAKEKVLGFVPTKARQAGKVVKDDGAAAVVIADFLVASKCM